MSSPEPATPLGGTPAPRTPATLLSAVCFRGIFCIAADLRPPKLQLLIDDRKELAEVQDIVSALVEVLDDGVNLLLRKRDPQIPGQFQVLFCANSSGDIISVLAASAESAITERKDFEHRDSPYVLCEASQTSLVRRFCQWRRNWLWPIVHCTSLVVGRDMSRSFESFLYRRDQQPELMDHTYESGCFVIYLFVRPLNVVVA
jgi:hypothetical protein